MKTSFRTLCLILAAGCALATLAQFAGLFTIPGVPTAALLGGSVACAAVAFVLGDYERKPAFRVRRSVEMPPDTDVTVNRPAGPGPDWTYSTKSK